MWDLPRPGLEPVSPALAGGFLTTVPPGKDPEKSSCAWKLETTFLKKIKRKTLPYNPWVKEEINGNYDIF